MQYVSISTAVTEFYFRKCGFPGHDPALHNKQLCWCSQKTTFY